MVTSCVWHGCINNSLCTLNFVNSVEPRTGNTDPSQGDTMRGKPIVYETLDTGCIVPTSHKLNKDGYFRTRDHRFNGVGRKPLIMNHRLVWELHNGPIPEHYEINHMCKNRACCNINHLELIHTIEHTVITNEDRYLTRYFKAKGYWESTRCTGIELSKVFDVSFSSACKWIREWKV